MIDDAPRAESDPRAQSGRPGLDEAVVIVTGASSGLGEQFARALDLAGARLVLAARRGERLAALAAELRDAHPVSVDVTDDAGRKRLLDDALDRYGHVDCLVNNAGISNVTPALKEAIDDFRRVLEVNVVAAFALSQLAARRMRENGGGSIVSIASIVGQRAIAAIPQASYSASKGALISMTRELAAQWGRYGIRVNAIAPGSFATEMTGAAFVDGGPLAELIRASVPLGRPGRAGELDSALLMLLDPASAYVTGQVIAVDGGLTAQ